MGSTFMRGVFERGAMEPKNVKSSLSPNIKRNLD